MAIAKQAPETVPCFLLARLAVDIENGAGAEWDGALRDAMQRVVLLSESVAAPALLVHARDDETRGSTAIMRNSLQSPWIRFICSCR